MAPNNLINIVDNTKQILEAFNKQVQKGLDAIGLKAERYAKSNCPVDTGRLRNSITYATAKGHDSGASAFTGKKDKKTGKVKGGSANPKDWQMKGQPEQCAVYIGSNVEYAAVQEYHDMAHNVGQAHFLRDAATTHGEEYRETMEAALKA